jgi:hypothetical protein
MADHIVADVVSGRVRCRRREQPPVNKLFFRADFREDRVEQRKTRLAIKQAAGEDLIWFDAAV